MRRKSWTQFTVLVAVLALNAFVVLQITGVAYEPFSWKAFAFVYNVENSCDVSPDDDGDCIIAPRDLDEDLFNPSGCFYDSRTGEIIGDRGGFVSSNDPNNCGVHVYPGTDGEGGGATNVGACHVPIPDNTDPMDGSLGCYSFLLKATPEHFYPATDGSEAEEAVGPLPAPITIAITVPDGCALDTLNDTCLVQPGTFSPPANMNEVSEPLGSPPNAGRTMLAGGGFPCEPDGGCECVNNPWYQSVDLSQATPYSGGTPPYIPVVHNNIPLLCDTPLGGGCLLEEPDHCASNICVERELSEGPGGICCNSICNLPGQVCDMEGLEGSCFTTAPAPAMSPTGLTALLGILVAIGLMALRRRRASV